MKSSIENSPSHSVKGKVRGLRHESLYGAWTTFCLLNGEEPKELLEPVLLRRLIFTGLVDSDKEILPFSTHLGVTPKEVRQMIGLDIGGVDRHQTYFMFTSLRYCRECLLNGYHSILFQHVGLSKCPLHGSRLLDTCTECGSSIEPTFRTASTNPFECPECSYSLVRFNISSDGSKWATLVDHMLGARRSVLVRGVDVAHQVNRLKGLDFGRYARSSPVTSRHYARVCIWAQPGDTNWPVFTEQKVPIFEAHAREGLEARREMHMAVDRVLLSLLKHCTGHEKATIRLLGRLGRYPRGLRLNAYTSVISVAIYKLAAAYDLLPRLMHILESKEDNAGQGTHTEHWVRPPVRLSDGCPEYPRFSAKLLEFEMWGLFAKLMVAHPKDDYLDQVSWLAYPHPIEYGPCWRIERSADEAYARVRVRADESAVMRLLKRRWDHALRFRHKDSVGDDQLWKHNFLDSLWHENEGEKELPSAPMSPIKPRVLRTRHDDLVRSVWGTNIFGHPNRNSNKPSENE